MPEVTLFLKRKKPLLVFSWQESGTVTTYKCVYRGSGLKLEGVFRDPPTRIRVEW